MAMTSLVQNATSVDAGVRNVRYLLGQRIEQATAIIRAVEGGNPDLPSHQSLDGADGVLPNIIEAEVMVETLGLLLNRLASSVGKLE